MEFVGHEQRYGNTPSRMITHSKLFVKKIYRHTFLLTYYNYTYTIHVYQWYAGYSYRLTGSAVAEMMCLAEHNNGTAALQDVTQEEVRTLRVTCSHITVTVRQGRLSKSSYVYHLANDDYELLSCLLQRASVIL